MNHSRLNILPIEIFHEICQYLDVYELLELKIVCKKLYFIVKEFKIKELIFNFSDNCSKDIWFFTNRPLNFKFNLENSKLFLLRTYRDNLVNNLKRLKIRQLDDKSCISLVDVNKFLQLEQLDIFLKNCKRKENERLVLVKLRTLSIKLLSSVLEINAPNLIAFYLNNSNSIYSLKSIKFDCRPLSVRHLKIFTYHDVVEAVFSNLEYLECYRSNYLNQSILFAFPNLKELRIQHYYESNLLGILETIASNRRETFKVFYNGIQLQDANDLQVYKDQPVFPLQISNFKFLDNNLNWFNCINFNDLLSLTDKIPRDFFRKYTNIQELRVSKLRNESELISFIFNCQNLEKLNALDASFTQQFYDRLPVVSSFIYLNIFEENRAEIDFKFLSRMFSLADVRTNQEIKIVEQLNLNKLNRLKMISFKINAHYIDVNRKGKDRYFIHNPEKFRLPNRDFSFNDLIKWCNYLKN